MDNSNKIHKKNIKTRLIGLSKKDLLKLYLKEIKNKQKLKRQLSNLKALAYSDALTTKACLQPIYNRLYWETIYKKIKKTDRCCLCMIDINDLSVTNNTLGHLAGDKCICQCVKQLIPFGKVFRFGGDEFILIVDNDKIADFKQTLIVNKDSLNFSYGIYVKQPKESLDTALQKADKIMYNMKYKNKKNNKTC